MQKTLVLIISTIITGLSWATNPDLNRLVELEYQIFDSEDAQCRAELILEKTALLVDNMQYQDAIDQLKRIDAIGIYPAQEMQTHKQQAICYFQLKKFETAIYYLQNMEQHTLSSDTTLLYMYLQSLAQCEKFIQCKSEMRTRNFPDSILQDLPDSVATVDPMRYFKYSNLPGYGQIKLQRYREASHSILLCSGFAAFTVYNGLLLYPATAAAFGAIPLIKFYTGGKLNAANLARKQNDTKILSTKVLFAHAIDRVLLPPIQ